MKRKRFCEEAAKVWLREHSGERWTVRAMAEAWGWPKSTVHLFVQKAVQEIVQLDKPLDKNGRENQQLNGISFVQEPVQDVVQKGKKEIKKEERTKEEKNKERNQNPAGGAPARVYAQGRGSRLPENFSAPDDWWIAASRRRNECGLGPCNRQLADITFANYWAAKTGKDATKTNWKMTYVNWVLKERAMPNDRRTAAAEEHARAIHDFGEWARKRDERESLRRDYEAAD